MLEHDLPLIARLTLYALGAVEGGRIRKPIDPVAGWLLRNRASLHPRGVSAAAYCTIRARTNLLDRMLRDELARARARGDTTCLWVLGGAFDARWYRFEPQFRDVVVEYREVEVPDLIRFKDKLLRDSPYADQWARVEQRPKPSEGWTVRPRSGARPLVLLEGLAGRIPPDALRRLLERIRYETPEARVLLGLPGRSRDQADAWTHSRLCSLGFVVEEDMSMGPRGRLMTPVGDELCPGMYPLRMLRLAGRDKP